MRALVVLSHSELMQIQAKDNNEDLVDLRMVCPNIVFNIASYIRKNGGEPAVEDAHYARNEVSKRLNTAQEHLPTGLHLMIDCAYRSPVMQQKSYDAVSTKLRLEHPSWSKIEIAKEMEKRVSLVEFAPHCTGGAVDLTIVNGQGWQLDMGTSLDEFSEKTYTKSLLISKNASFNRSILIESMTYAGFVNFPAEWWHWSYGDREWANMQKDKIALYESLER